MPEKQLQLIKAIPNFFLDGLGLGLKLVDASSGQILLANTVFCEMTGYSRNEVLQDNMSFDCLTFSGDRDTELMQHRLLQAGRIEHYKIDKRYIRRNGSMFWGRVTSAAVRDDAGHIRWRSCIVEDITDKKLMDDYLAAAEQMTGLATWNWKVATDSSVSSSGYNALFGLPNDTPSPSVEQFLARVHPDDRERMARAIKDAVLGKPYLHEYRAVDPNGNIRWLRGMGSNVTNAAGEVTNLVGATLDITHEKSARTVEPAPASIRKAIRFMEDRWMENLSITAVASQAGISERALHRYFSARGTSPKRFAKKIKLRHAREMLSNPTAKTTVSEVALKCGFANLGHFAKDYQIEFGEVPSAALTRAKSVLD